MPAPEAGRPSSWSAWRHRPFGERALAEVLAAQFTVFNYDRRGRGESGDTLPYAVAREIQDIAAARDAPFWPELEALAPTLAYDAACLGDGAPPVRRLAAIGCPTLV